MTRDKYVADATVRLRDRKGYPNEVWCIPTTVNPCPFRLSPALATLLSLAHPARRSTILSAWSRALIPSIPGSLLPMSRGGGAGAGAGGGTGVATGASRASLYAGEYEGRPTGV